MWLLARVLAWPAGRPTAAVVLLAIQATFYLLIAMWEGATGRPTIKVRIRRRGDR